MKKEKVKMCRIKVVKEVRQDLRKMYGCSYTTIYQALAFFSNGGRARDIRKYALDHGGIIIEEEKIV